MSGFVQYLVRRLGVSLVSLLGVALIVVLLTHLLPGDPARTIAGVLADQEEVDRLRRQLALDRPILVQYLHFVAGLLHGDLGESARTGQPVSSEIFARLPATLALAVTGTLVGSVLGVVAGVVAAVRKTTTTDHVVSTLSVTGVSVPIYWLGLMLVIVFAVELGWLPAAGAEQPTSIILPSVALGFFIMALVARMTRSTMLEVLGEDYVRTARAKGASERRVVYKHALRNAFIPVLTVIGLQFGNLLGGAVLTETVFAWPGIGRLLVDSIFARDFPMVQGIVLVYAVLLVVVNLMVDLMYTWIDPRISFHG
ncbi:MAG TPA: ABC transporter permease [Micromonosporaceae bacterium]|nr:ABC transporter permease [Micromonosporaceae bacterium]